MRRTVKDFTWKQGMTVAELVSDMNTLGFQSIEIAKAKDIIVRMKQEGAKIYLSFTSNMVTSGLRGFFAQLISLGIVDAVSTTAGGIEEDIMRALGERFGISSYSVNDIGLYEQGLNRVGNLVISNQSYGRFEDFMMPTLKTLYDKQKSYTPSELLREIGLLLSDEQSFLFQAAKHNVPVFCPALTDGAIGFQMYMFKCKYRDFVIDIVQDFSYLLSVSSHDSKKGLICLGGGLSKHHAILGMLLNGGCDYAVYLTTARSHSGSMSGATTEEAKSWGKVKDSADAATVIGDVTVSFPIIMIAALEELKQHGLINNS